MIDQRLPGIDVDRRAEPLGHLNQWHLLAEQLPIAIDELVHGADGTA